MALQTPTERGLYIALRSRTFRRLGVPRGPVAYVGIDSRSAAEKAAAYSRHVYDIAASTNAEVTKVAEEQFADVQKKFMATVDSAVKNAPAGTENAVALVKSAVAAANNAYESVHKAAKQAADVAEANFQAITSTAVKAAQAPKSKRAA